ncbi:MAG: hypothetical protein ABI780_14560, partial [Ardenticatenales bacterium]
MDLPSLARALDALIDRHRRVGHADDGGAFDDEAGPLDGLAELAAALDALPKAPAPTHDFRATLAARLMAAP